MLIEVGIGDAYGSCFEGSDLGHILAYNDLQKYHDEELSLVPAGHYTDDTQMTVALAEAYVDGWHEFNFWTKEKLADKFVEVFQRDVRRGYTGYFFNALLHSKDGAALLEKIDGKSEKSGAAMRCGFLGYLPDIEDVVELTTIQAKVTHDSEVGITSAIAASLMVHYFEYDVGDKDKLSSWLNNKLPLWSSESAIKELRDCWHPGERVRTFAWDCVNAAIKSIELHDNLADILHQSVAWSGDTDTVAAIAMAAACRSKEIKQNMPQVLYDNLENGDWGRDFLISLDADL